MEVLYHLVVLHRPNNEVVVAPARNHLIVGTKRDRPDSATAFRHILIYLLSITDLKTAHK